mmetsp:Transcript_113992/g.302974  ORF Transcript_113992/g.302974 Transcript_113992/m.302974 type:complete len:207 (-) Transcript_113992:521-1141(-)
MLLKDAPEVRVRQLQAQCCNPILTKLVLPAPLQQGRVATPDLKGKRVGRLEVAIRPVYRRARTSIAHFMACGAKGAPAVIGIDRCQDPHHGLLLLVQLLLNLVRPRHVKTTSPAVHTQEQGGLVVLDNLPDKPGLWLAEGLWTATAAHGMAGRPLLVPIAVQVHAPQVESPAVVSLLNKLACPGARVEDYLKLAVLQRLLGIVVAS